jgi:uncharacterized protein (DUF3820 family)
MRWSRKRMPRPCFSLRYLNQIPMNKTSTTVEITDNTPMPFGQHRGKAMINIPAKYLLAIYEKDMCYHEGVKRYIINNMDGLRKEAGLVKR